MEITGHKSVQSLTIYQYVRDGKKIDMAKTLSTALSKTDQEMLQEKQKENQAQIGTLASILKEPNMNAHVNSNSSVIQEVQKEPQMLVSYEPNWDDVQDFNLLDLLADLDENPSKVAVPESKKLTTTVDSPVKPITTTMTMMQQHNSLMFAGCKISQITININKK